MEGPAFVLGRESARQKARQEIAGQFGRFGADFRVHACDDSLVRGGVRVALAADALDIAAGEAQQFDAHVFEEVVYDDRIFFGV
jgi:hypothetical protein